MSSYICGRHSKLACNELGCLLHTQDANTHHPSCQCNFCASARKLYQEQVHKFCTKYFDDTQWCMCSKCANERAQSLAERTALLPRAPFLTVRGEEWSDDQDAMAKPFKPFDPPTYKRVGFYRPVAAQRDETWHLIKDGEREQDRRELIEIMCDAHEVYQCDTTVTLWMSQFKRILNYLESDK